jgi:hypothetical protein
VYNRRVETKVKLEIIEVRDAGNVHSHGESAALRNR